MSNEAMDYVKELVEHAHFIGAAGLIAAAVRTGQIPVMLAPMYAHTAKVRARTYVCRLKVNEKALRCANSEKAQNEESTKILQDVPITPGACAQPAPLAADLEGLAISLGVLAGKVPAEEWEFLKIFRTNLRAVAERVAALENSLEAPRG